MVGGVAIKDGYEHKIELEGSCGQVRISADGGVVAVEA
jgi:hypothetical protein